MENNEFFDIYFSDLNEDAQKRLLSAVGETDPKEMNWDIDIFPIAMYPIPKDILEIKYGLTRRPPLLFSHRMQIENLFLDWANEHGVAIKPNCLIAYMQGQNWLNEEKMVEDLEFMQNQHETGE